MNPLLGGEGVGFSKVILKGNLCQIFLTRMPENDVDILF
jgi:hypothetical protein